MESLSYANTPLALASLIIIAGIGVLKLLVGGKNNAINRLITHYGFAAVIIFGLLGNISYLYSMHQSSETIILGNVVDEDGKYLPNVAIDTGGHARGMTSDTGDFVLAIPASRKNEEYEITAALPGYEKARKTIKNSSRMFVRFELSPKKIQTSDILRLSDSELIVGHYLGLPEIYSSFTINNTGAAPLTVKNLALSLTSPSGKKRDLIQVSSAAINGPAGPPLPQIQVRAGDSFSWTSGFIQYDSQVQQLAAQALQALQSNENFRKAGPIVGREMLPQHLTKSLQNILNDNWYWEAGTTTVQISFNANGTRHELVNKLTLSNDQIAAMKKSTEYYSAGYGIIFGAELTPIGSALPGQRISIGSTQ